jgi:hypothetical protein
MIAGFSWSPLYRFPRDPGGTGKGGIADRFRYATFEDLSLLSIRQAAIDLDAPSQSNCNHALDSKV